MYDIELKNELERRWSSVREELARQQADALLVTTNVNLYYVSGRVFAGMAYIPNEGEPLFFVRRPVGLKGENVLYICKPEEMSDRLRERGSALPRKLLLETDSIPMSEYLRYEKIFSPEQTGNGTRLLRSVRSVKTPFELGRLRLSGRLHAEVYRRIPELFRPGMTDLELSVEIERESRLKGSRGIFRIFGQSMEIFGGSVLAGDNADTPSPYDFALGGGGLDTSLPVGANGTVLSDGMSVMVDMGGNFTGYMTDMTRVFSIGKLPDLAYRAHDTSLEIQRRIAEAAQPGTPTSELYAIAVHTAAEAGLSEYFMGHRQQAGFVGHGIGIEINEMPVLAPRSKEILAEGMVFALEPKFVIPGVGAVGIENSFAVTAGGLEKLTPMDEEIVPLA
ncbi:M24 family metallopeptidase [Alistipes ihumii]|uniref:M24 family metallopeptidase n=1 Tax=Alistipes ihumii TaxID=1470347 RepID=UPI003AB1CC6E